ncbi:MAG: MBOAT family protein [Hydrogenophaga sp.]|jgi:D-alanyl-lipoteichoic acid acyltransferase DltB (MBOAT superfamily)|nr:MBOAT family protein [Hydrogenophaga sp.]
MLFNSAVYLFAFLPVALVVYFGLCRLRWVKAAQAWLVVASLFFYSYWKLEHLPLLLASLLANFMIGSELANPRLARSRHARRGLLGLGIAGNVALLGYFKYINFLVDNLSALGGWSLDWPQVVLPLAISFFTFQQIAYLVDSHRGHTREYDFLRYALFVCFFPQLIAGPIVHHHEMMPQFAQRRNWVPRHRNLLAGLCLFAVGLFKKVVIADTFAPWADRGFDGGQALDFFEAWVTSLSYTFQLYFDFSGYCDMAMGAALMFNIRLPLNFNSPYKALDIQDFWRRWHITLGRFLRDYVYIPLGGNRHAEWQTCTNLFLTFLIGGLWHGAGWMFVAWGALHGAALVVHRTWKNAGLRLPSSLAWLLTFLFVNVAWVFFRATSLDDALRVLRGMVDLPGALGKTAASIPTEGFAWGGWSVDLWLQWLPAAMVAQLPCLAALLGSAVLLAAPNSGRLLTAAVGWKLNTACAALMVVAVSAMLASTSTVFLYFNF